MALSGKRMRTRRHRRQGSGRGLRDFRRLFAGGFRCGERAVALEFAEIRTVGTAHFRVLGLKAKGRKHGGIRRGQCACEVFHGGTRQ